jgi:hypothetical protein
MKRRLIGIVVVAAAVELTYGLFPSHLQALPPAPPEWKLLDQAAYRPVPPEIQVWRGTSYARAAWRARYTGPARITLTLYEMPAWPARAFDALQKWSAVPGKLAFMKSRYFGVVESPDADRPAIERFIEGVTAGLPNGDLEVR